MNRSLLDEIGGTLTVAGGSGRDREGGGARADEVVQLITASGTPDEYRAKVREYVGSGATCQMLHPLGNDVGAMIDAFEDGGF